MFVVGLIVGLVGPRMGARLEQVERRSQRLDIEDQLRQLPRRVRLAGRNIELPKDQGLADLGDGARILDLPSGWVLEIQPPLVIAANGACSGATLLLIAPDELPLRYQIAEPTCELSQPPY